MGYTSIKWKNRHGVEIALCQPGAVNAPGQWAFEQRLLALKDMVKQAEQSHKKAKHRNALRHTAMLFGSRSTAVKKKTGGPRLARARRLAKPAASQPAGAACPPPSTATSDVATRPAE